MRMISEGRATKEHVVKHNAEIYKRIFLEVAQKSDRLEKALARYFVSAAANFAQEMKWFSICGGCRSKASLRITDNNVNILSSLLFIRMNSR